MGQVAFRELWHAEHPKRHVTVRVFEDGRRQIEGRSRIPSKDVPKVLEAEGYTFAHLLPKPVQA
jgi:hypothetical protein